MKMRYFAVARIMYLSVIALSVILSGCDSSTNHRNGDSGGGRGTLDTSSSFANQQDLSQLSSSWQRFVSSAKSRVSQAEANYLSRWDIARSVRVDWGVDDIVETKSITAPYVGKINLTVILTDQLGTGRYIYSLEFIPQYGTWKYRGGKKQRFDRSGTADEVPLDYPALQDEIKVLFDD